MCCILCPDACRICKQDGWSKCYYTFTDSLRIILTQRGEVRTILRAHALLGAPARGGSVPRKPSGAPDLNVSFCILNVTLLNLCRNPPAGCSKGNAITLQQINNLWHVLLFILRKATRSVFLIASAIMSCSLCALVSLLLFTASKYEARPRQLYKDTVLMEAFAAMMQSLIYAPFCTLDDCREAEMKPR